MENISKISVYLILILISISNSFSADNSVPKLEVYSEDSVITAIFGISGVDNYPDRSSKRYQNSQKYTYANFLKIDVAKIADQLEENTIESSLVLGKELKKTSYFAGEGCSSDSFKISQFEKADIIYGYDNSYFIFSSKSSTLCAKNLIGKTSAEVLTLYPGAYSSTSNSIIYLCYDRIEATNSPAAQAYSLLIQIVLENNRVSKILVEIPFSC